MNTSLAEHPSPTQTTALSAPSATEWPPLTASDRCDKCGDANVQAYVRVIYRTGDLLYCNHHFRANQANIREYALDVHDESGKLTERKPTVGDGFA